MISKVIELLKDNLNGFFLQVEGVFIDKQDYVVNLCGQIGEIVDFDEVVQKVLVFVKVDGEILVIVIVDYVYFSQIILLEIVVLGLI